MLEMKIRLSSYLDILRFLYTISFHCTKIVCYDCLAICCHGSNTLKDIKLGMKILNVYMIMHIFIKDLNNLRNIVWNEIDPRGKL